MKTALCILSLTLFIEISCADILRVPSEYSNIAGAVFVAEEGDTVIVEPGTYEGGILLTDENITLASEFILTGDTATISATVIEITTSGSVLQINGSEITEATVIEGLTFTQGFEYQGGGIHCIGASPIIRNNHIEGNTADAGGGIYCTGGSPKILHNIIRNNSIISPIGNPGGGICCMNDGDAEIAYNLITGNLNQDGAGIACVFSNPWIHHNVIAENQALDLGGAIRCDFSDPLIENNVFADNEAGTGGGLAILLTSSPVIRNCIVWGNQGTQIHASGATPVISFSNIQGGWNGEGNMDLDPLFRNPAALDYRLQHVDCGSFDSSPCIDAGSPENVDSLLNCDWGLGEPRADMGAFGGGLDTTISHAITPPIVESHLICSSYPNPFNASTTLEFSLPLASDVTLSVFNALGQEVYRRNLGRLNSGIHTHYFDAQNLSSGFYLVRLETSYTVAKSKLLLLR